jgi:hypothetical protein
MSGTVVHPHAKNDVPVSTSNSSGPVAIVGEVDVVVETMWATARGLLVVAVSDIICTLQGDGGVHKMFEDQTI